MSSNTKRPASEASHKTAPLIQVLSQSEQVHEKVESAAVELSAVNKVLKDEIVPLAKVERALRKSESVEVKVQEAAAELVAVNDALAEEVDERHHLEEQLSETDEALTVSRAEARRSRNSTMYDAVTGLPNLTLFNDRLSNALAQAERHVWHLAVMFIDLDGFKSVNDTYGHDAGDQVLRGVAERLKTIVRKGDTVSRRSGDEFLFLMLEVTSEANVETLAARIGDKIAEALDIDGAKVTVTASIGIALCPEDGRTAPELLKNADLAMYAAKQEKKGLAFFGRMARP